MPQPVLIDQYTAARAYFASIIGLFVVESLIRLPGYLYLKSATGRRRAWPVASHWQTTVLLHKIVSLPSPVPWLIDYHVPHIIRFLVFAAINVVFSLNDNEYSTDYKLYGWLCIANGGLALLMAARSNLFAIVLRIPSPILLQYHRWIGLATFAHATTHISYNIQHYIATDQLVSSFEANRIQVGMMAWTALTLIFLTSLPIVRRRFFEVFYYSHALFFVFVVGALIHTTNGPEFLLPGLGLWAVDRAIRFAYNFRTIKLQSVAHFEGDVSKFRVSGRLLGNAQPGQIAWIQFPSVSFLNWHPFTVMRSPNEHSEKQSIIAVRGLGGYTRKVQYVDIEDKVQSLTMESSGHASASMPLTMRLDGPYGVGRINWGILPLTILIAGGIGITPSFSIASTLIHNSIRSEGATKSHIHLLWIVKDSSHLEWFREELELLVSLASRESSNISFDIDIHATTTMQDQSPPVQVDKQEVRLAGSKEWQVRPGRPDIQSWILEIKNAHPGCDGALNVCGPRSLIREARKAALRASSKNGIFHVEEEVFEF